MSFLPYGGGRAGWFGAFTASGIVHGGLVAGLLGVYGQFLVPPDPERSPTAFLVTLDRLDDPTLSGTADLDEAGREALDPEAERETPEGLEAETPEAIAAEAADGVAAEVAEGASAETAAAMAAETAAAMAAETADAMAAEVLDAADTAAEAPPLVQPEAVAAEAVTAIPIAADDPDLSPIVPETVAAAETVTPVGRGDGLLSPDAPAAATVLALNATPAPPPAMPEGAARPAAVRPPPSAQDLAIGALIGRIRGAAADPCLVALPRRDGAEGLGLAMIAADEVSMEVFAQAALTAEADAALRQTRTLIDPRQCPVLRYVRGNRDYPATGMGLRLDTPEVPSGGRLTGVLRGAAGRHVTLLLIDDNGVVQDLQRFLAFSGNLTRFDVPVTRAGPARDTSQFLLAIATRRPPDAIRARIGRLAQDVFTGLDGELATAAALAVATFDVR